MDIKFDVVESIKLYVQFVYLKSGGRGGGGWFMLLENKKKFKEFKNLSVKLKKSYYSSILKLYIKFINLNIINVFLSVLILIVWLIKLKWL